MGADIHMVLEKFWPDTGEWVGVNAFPYVQASVYGSPPTPYTPGVYSGAVHWDAVSRNYTLFAELANVRGDGDGRDPVGLPDDASSLTRMMSESWGVDGHSHTWMLMDEALPIFIRTGQFGDPSKAVVDAMTDGLSVATEQFMHYFWSLDYEEDLKDFRLCMWFDN